MLGAWGRLALPLEPSSPVARRAHPAHSAWPTTWLYRAQRRVNARVPGELPMHAYGTNGSMVSVWLCRMLSDSSTSLHLRLPGN